MLLSLKEKRKLSQAHQNLPLGKIQELQKRVAKEQEMNKAIEKGGLAEKNRRKYVAPLESDEERIESDENGQFRVVSHTTKSDLENICDNIRDNAYFV